MPAVLLNSHLANDGGCVIRHQVPVAFFPMVYTQMSIVVVISEFFMSAEPRQTRFEDLKLLPGQALQLDFEGYSSDRDRSLLVGYRAGQGIIVTTPIVNGSPLVLKLGTPLAVRLFATQVNSACAFRTEVTHISRVPYPHLHLAMPKQLQLGEVRKTVRARVDVICSVHFGDGFRDKTSARILDLSLGGARINTRNMAATIGDDIKLTAQISVSGIERIVTVSAIVRSLTPGGGTDIQAGLQFTEMSDSDRITLHAFVLSNIHN